MGLILKTRYELIELIGKGGQCHVYLAKDRQEDRKVVVKELTRTSKDKIIQAQNIEMFKKEYELFCKLDHPALPAGYEYFEEKGKHYLVVEYIQGKNLKTVLDNMMEPFSEEEAVHFGINLAEALVYLSHIKPHPVVIRDIKPSNIMLTPEGSLKLIDFTIAREFDSSKEGDTVKIGSIGYAPPEQYKGLSDCRSDIYALGVTLYEILTKHDPSATPFQFEPVRHLDPSISSRMNGILEKAMELDPRLRYEKPEDILKDLCELSSAKKDFKYEELFQKIEACEKKEKKDIKPLKKFSFSWVYILILLLILFFIFFMIFKGIFISLV